MARQGVSERTVAECGAMSFRARNGFSFPGFPSAFSAALREILFCFVFPSLRVLRVFVVRIPLFPHRIVYART
jgi:hypothetical protein